jgi:hypothetical protein
MGKTFYNLYDKICHPLNLWWAYKDAARGKRYRPAAASFEYDLERNLIEIEQELQDGTYQPGDYHSFRIEKPKKRLVNISVPPTVTGTIQRTPTTITAFVVPDYFQILLSLTRIRWVTSIQRVRPGSERRLFLSAYDAGK